jgi:hypothetical protein
LTTFTGHRPSTIAGHHRPGVSFPKAARRACGGTAGGTRVRETHACRHGRYRVTVAEKGARRHPPGPRYLERAGPRQKDQITSRVAHKAGIALHADVAAGAVEVYFACRP